VLATSVAALAIATPVHADIGPMAPGGSMTSSSARAGTEPKLREILAMVGMNGEEGAGGRGGASRCEWIPGTLSRLPGGLVPAGGRMPQMQLTDLDGTKMSLYGRQCGNRLPTWMWVRQVSPRQLAAIGTDLVREKLPVPRALFSPDVTGQAARAVVHLPLWFAVPSGQWAPVSATASIPGLAATVTARPHRLTFDPGDGGGSVSCTGPGPRYRPGMPEPARPPDCSYTYWDASTTAPGGVRWPARRSINWQVSWSATNGDGGSLGPLTTTASYAVPVQEIQAIEAAKR
jgi:hypothetical protein